MTRAAPFTQGAVTKLLKAARAAGQPVTSVEIDRHGKIVARFDGQALEPSGDADSNEWDEVLPDGAQGRTAR